MLKSVEPVQGSFGKSAGLYRLRSRLSAAEIPAFRVVSLDEWRSSRTCFLQKCQDELGPHLLAVRSDAASEDQEHSSQAGRFRSHLNVAPHHLEAAIDDVFETLPGLPHDQVMVQTMITDVAMAGVASTHRIHDGAPWYCIELSTGDSATVTAGRSTGRMHAIRRAAVDHPQALAQLSTIVRQALDLLREIEDLLRGQPLEIEFALGAGKVDKAPPSLYLFQVRPIVQTQWARPSARIALPDAGFLCEPDPCAEVAGPQTVLSLMADWNPAELLGSHPRPLALSLFQHLISDQVWWQARAEMGYASPPGSALSLLHVWQGRPMVDVRRSANSLLPAGLGDDLRGRLVQHVISTLQERPELHDKVEFEVYRTIRDLKRRSDVRAQWVDVLGADGWCQWEAALGRLARSLTSTLPGSLFSQHWDRVCSLSQTSAVSTSSLGWLARLQRSRLGSRSFAVLARLAFIGEAQLRSVVEREALTPERALHIKASARQRFAHFMPPGLVGRGAEQRPGAFDILQRPVPASPPAEEPSAGGESRAFFLSAAEDRTLTALLREAELPLTASEWLVFVQTTASAREWAKQVFSAELSMALELIATGFEDIGLDREAASWLSLDQLAAEPALGRESRASWADQARQACALHAGQAQQMVGPVLWHPDQRDVVDSFNTLPNFVGQRVAEGPLLIEPRPDQPAAELHHAVVLLQQADPGFDWLFNHPIAGLITVWGGANSHMAIRCAERGLAAAIGCGEHVLVKARKACRATIDPAGGGLWLH